MVIELASLGWEQLAVAQAAAAQDKAADKGLGAEQSAVGRLSAAKVARGQARAVSAMLEDRTIPGAWHSLILA